MRISVWISDVCSSDLRLRRVQPEQLFDFGIALAKDASRLPVTGFEIAKHQLKFGEHGGFVHVHHGPHGTLHAARRGADRLRSDTETAHHYTRRITLHAQRTMPDLKPRPPPTFSS